VPALADRSFNPKAWARLGLVALGLAAVALVVWATTFWHEDAVEVPRLLEKRFEDPPGRVGNTTTRISKLGAKAVPTLVGDLKSTTVSERAKALELLSTIDDPRVVPALASALQDADTGVRLTAMAGLARTGKREAAKALWTLVENPSDLIRLRALVALGLTGGPDDAAKLLADLAKVTGHERYVQAWAAGRIHRRAVAQNGYLPAAPDGMDDAAEQRIQGEVDTVLQALDKLEDPLGNAKKLSQLTDVAFATWDQGHQLAVQTLAVLGPLAVRRSTGESAVAAPPPTQRALDLKPERLAPVPR
jgi:hypothetical protein